MFMRIEEIMPKANIMFNSLNMPDSDDNIDIKTVPVRDFSSAKNINPSQVYTELSNTLIEFKMDPETNKYKMENVELKLLEM